MLPTASSIQRAMMCPGSMVLPRVQNINEGNKRGSAVHLFLRDSLKLGREKALLSVADEYRLDCEEVDLSKLPPNIVESRAEATFKFNPKTGKGEFVGCDLDRNYPSDDGCFYGTADLFGYFEKGFPVILDYKTGDSYVPPPRENWQLRMLAVAAGRYCNAERVCIGIVSIRGGETVCRTEVLEQMDLDLDAANLSSLADRHVQESAKGDGKAAYSLTTGSHCDWCPSRVYCPAQTAIIRELAGESATDLASSIQAMLTPQNAAKAYNRLKQVRNALRNVEKALYGYAAQNPIELGEGLYFGATTSKREELDGIAVYSAVQKMLGTEAANVACEIDATKASIKRAVKKAKEEGIIKSSMAEAEREILANVKMSGGITERSQTRVAEHRKGDVTDGLD